MAVITGLPTSFARRIMRFWVVGTKVQGHLNAEVAAGDHYGIGLVEDLSEVVNGFLDFDFCDE